ncbi:hypothetical protein SNEBB_010087 [Seison nebaliae]|nr:hypothetical protein SNEBB_010087 [Seison nebaliae]
MDIITSPHYSTTHVRRSKRIINKRSIVNTKKYRRMKECRRRLDDLRMLKILINRSYKQELEKTNYATISQIEKSHEHIDLMKNIKYERAIMSEEDLKETKTFETKLKLSNIWKTHRKTCQSIFINILTRNLPTNLIYNLIDIGEEVLEFLGSSLGLTINNAQMTVEGEANYFPQYVEEIEDKKVLPMKVLPNPLDSITPFETPRRDDDEMFLGSPTQLIFDNCDINSSDGTYFSKIQTSLFNEYDERESLMLDSSKRQMTQIEYIKRKLENMSFHQMFEHNEVVNGREEIVPEFPTTWTNELSDTTNVKQEQRLGNDHLFYGIWWFIGSVALVWLYNKREETINRLKKFNLFHLGNAPTEEENLYFFSWINYRSMWGFIFDKKDGKKVDLKNTVAAYAANNEECFGEVCPDKASPLFEENLSKLTQSGNRIVDGQENLEIKEVSFESVSDVVNEIKRIFNLPRSETVYLEKIKDEKEYLKDFSDVCIKHHLAPKTKSWIYYGMLGAAGLGITFLIYRIIKNSRSSGSSGGSSDGGSKEQSTKEQTQPSYNEQTKESGYGTAQRTGATGTQGTPGGGTQPTGEGGTQYTERKTTEHTSERSNLLTGGWGLQPPGDENSQSTEGTGTQPTGSKTRGKTTQPAGSGSARHTDVPSTQKTTGQSTYPTQGEGTQYTGTPGTGTQQTPGQSTHPTQGGGTQYTGTGKTQQTPGYSSHHTDVPSTQKTTGNSTYPTQGGGTQYTGTGKTQQTPGTGTQQTPRTGTQKTPGTGTQQTPGQSTHQTQGGDTQYTGTGKTQQTPGTGTQQTSGHSTHPTEGGGTQYAGTGKTQQTPGEGTQYAGGPGTQQTPGHSTHPTQGGGTQYTGTGKTQQTPGEGTQYTGGPGTQQTPGQSTHPTQGGGTQYTGTGKTQQTPGEGTQYTGTGKTQQNPGEGTQHTGGPGTQQTPEHSTHPTQGGGTQYTGTGKTQETPGAGTQPTPVKNAQQNLNKTSGGNSDASRTIEGS